MLMLVSRTLAAVALRLVRRFHYSAGNCMNNTSQIFTIHTAFSGRLPNPSTKQATECLPPPPLLPRNSTLLHHPFCLSVVETANLCKCTPTNSCMSCILMRKLLTIYDNGEVSRTREKIQYFLNGIHANPVISNLLTNINL